MWVEGRLGGGLGWLGGWGCAFGGLLGGGDGEGGVCGEGRDGCDGEREGYLSGELLRFLE